MPQDSQGDPGYPGAQGERPSWPQADPFGGPPGAAPQGAGQYGPPPGAGQYGPPPGQYGPPQGQYGPPPGQPQYQGQQYAGQQQYGGPQYGQQQYGAQGQVVPAGYQQGQSDDKTWSMLSYLGSILFGFIPPLVVYLVKKDESPFVRFHGAQSLNLAVSFIIYSVGLWIFSLILGAVTAGIGFVLGTVIWAAVGIAFLVFAIMGAVASNRGEMNTMPTWLVFPMFH
jgi:uncharacterized Tic20 family protein